MPPQQPGTPTFAVSYTAEKFARGTVAPSGLLTFRNHDLCRALFVTGRAPVDEWAHGAASRWEYIHRIAIARAYLRQGPEQALVRSDLAGLLDRTERAMLSYSLGMAMTAIFCDQLLSVSRLLHMDRYAAQHGVTFNATPKRADLIGRTRTGWVVAEAKGRSGAADAALRAGLREQKRSVSSIGGESPELALGCIAYFPPTPDRFPPIPDRRLHLHAVDPIDEMTGAVRYDGIDLDRYLFAYYRPFIAVLESRPGASTPQTPNEFEVIDLDFLGVTVGLFRPLAALTRQYLVRYNSGGSLDGYAEQIADMEFPAAGASRFADGSLFIARWPEVAEMPES